MNAQAGDLLKVSDFVNHGTVDGTWSVGTAAYDKRGVAAFVPAWDAENCIQCNKCAFVCPHACIRPFVLDEAEKAGFNEPTLDILLQSNSRVCNSASKYQFLTVQVVATVLMSAQVRRVTRHCQ